MPDDKKYFRKDRISTGVRDLDIVLEGGYAHPGAVFLFAPSGQEKIALSLLFAAQGLKEGDKVVYVALDMSPLDVERKASAFGFNLGSSPNLTFIDACAQKSSEESQKNTIKISGPEALNDLSLVLSDAIKDAENGKLRVIFHSLSTLSIYNPPETVMKFLQFVENRLKAAHATTLWVTDEGMHDKKFITALEAMADQKLYIHEQNNTHELVLEGVPIPIKIKAGVGGLEVL
ncbi:RAD55 family ATPase [Candidatus Micrarchaeota archaeon]|nr:RAD55 family ATPase [Candidatus Micrarchaeota archaeon]